MSCLCSRLKTCGFRSHCGTRLSRGTEPNFSAVRQTGTFLATPFDLQHVSEVLLNLFTPPLNRSFVFPSSVIGTCWDEVNLSSPRPISHTMEPLWHGPFYLEQKACFVSMWPVVRCAHTYIQLYIFFDLLSLQLFCELNENNLKNVMSSALNINSYLQLCLMCCCGFKSVVITQNRKLLCFHGQLGKCVLNTGVLLL